MGLMSTLGKITNVATLGMVKPNDLFGQETGPQFNPYQMRPLTDEEKALQTESNKAALSGLQSLQKQTYTPEQEAQMTANYQQSQQLGALRQGTEDARRKMAQQIAARGLQNSSIGLGAIAGQERDIAKAQSQVMNQQKYVPLQAEQIRRQRAMDLMNAAKGQQIRSEYDTGAASQRQGGLLPLIGAGLGGALGGVGGAQVGYGVGQAGIGSYR